MFLVSTFVLSGVCFFMAACTRHEWLAIVAVGMMIVSSALIMATDVNEFEEVAGWLKILLAVN